MVAAVVEVAFGPSEVVVEELLEPFEAAAVVVEAPFAPSVVAVVVEVPFGPSVVVAVEVLPELRAAAAAVGQVCNFALVENPAELAQIVQLVVVAA